MTSTATSSFLYPPIFNNSFDLTSPSNSSNDDSVDPFDNQIFPSKSMARKPSLPLTAPNSPDSHAFDKQVKMVEPLKSDGGASSIASGSITKNLQDLLKGIDVDSCEVDGESAFFVADLSEVHRQHVRWTNALPRVIPFYGEFLFASLPLPKTFCSSNVNGQLTIFVFCQNSLRRHHSRQVQPRSLRPSPSSSSRNRF